jgi:DUF1680 family protein
VKLSIDPAKKGKFNVYVRIPGWSRAQPVPGDTYFANFSVAQSLMPVKVNGKETIYEPENGYIVLNREWKKGDIVEFEFNMTPNLVTARKEIKQDENRVAIQRGPLVYCVEGADNDNKAWNIIVPENTVFTPADQKILDEPIVALQASVPVVTVGADGISIKTENKTITAIPYYVWANRGKNEMQVWLPTKIKDVKINY